MDDLRQQMICQGTFFFTILPFQSEDTMNVAWAIFVFIQTSAEITFTPYSRQMQLWPMMRSTLYPCPTSTPRRWPWTRCSATVTNPGDLEGASWVSSKRWWSNFAVCFNSEQIDWVVTMTTRAEWGPSSHLGLRYLPIISITFIHKANQDLIDTSKQCCCHLYKFPVFIT